MPAVELFIPGEPVTFATRHEGAWNATIREAASCIAPPGHDALSMAFAVSGMSRNGHAFDLDNLCEPVFAALCGAGWFGGRRAGLRMWSATKAVAVPAGVTVTAARDLSGHSTGGDGQRRGAVYRGALPQNAKDPILATWLAENLAYFGGPCAGSSVGLSLRFGCRALNIGSINGTKGVKAVIDGMYPLLGGRAGAPEDWRIDALSVEKGCTDLGQAELEILVW